MGREAVEDVLVAHARLRIERRMHRDESGLDLSISARKREGADREPWIGERRKRVPSEPEARSHLGERLQIAHERHGCVGAPIERLGEDLVHRVDRFRGEHRLVRDTLYVVELFPSSLLLRDCQH